MADLHSQLQQDCIVLGRFRLCHLLLVNDSHYPWFILVPDREAITEIHQLSRSDQHDLIEESCALSSLLQQHFHADKLNIAALGNVVPQLHIHHIVRYKTDPAWPAPIWGKAAALPYEEIEKHNIINMMKNILPADFSFI